MNFLEERIQKDGVVKEGNVLKVDSFLNHQMDIELFEKMGEEWKRRFNGKPINKVVTIEASGIGIACIVAKYFGTPVVFAKKSKSINIDGDMYVAEVESFTHKCKNQVIVSKKFLSPDDHVLIIDDFLANGCALHDYINWDEYFMGIALLTAMRSKDPSSQVGACIVSPENKILSLGYNGMPIGCDDDAMPWEREGEPLNTKYMYVCHAELNAILNSAHNNLKGARVYVTLFPCNECTKAIIQSGIAEVVYYGDKYHDSDSSIAARFMFEHAGVRLTPYKPTGRRAELEL